MRIRLIISIMTLCLGALSAQSAERVDTVQVRLYFKKGYSILEQGYCDNKAHLGTFSEKIADLQKDSLVQIRSVRITGSASPEGNTKLNNALSRKRANTAASFINQ